MPISLDEIQKLVDAQKKKADQKEEALKTKTLGLDEIRSKTNIQKTQVFGEKTQQKILSEYKPAATKFEEEQNKVRGLLSSLSLDKNLCDDLLGLKLGIVLKYPALPAIPNLLDAFLPKFDITCDPSLDIDSIKNQLSDPITVQENDG